MVAMRSEGFWRRRRASSSGEALDAVAEAALGDGFEAESQLIDALVAAVDGVAEAREHGLGRETGVALAGVHQVEAACSVDAGGEGGDAFFDAVLRGGDEFGCGGRRGSAKVGYEVGDGEVGLVADGGDDGELRRGDGAGEGLVVEAGEVFHGAAASRDDDGVDKFRMRVEPADACGYRAAARGALHGCGVDEEVEAGVAATGYGDDVADNRAGGRGDDADALREGWEWALAVGVEEAFGEEAGLELLEGELERSGAAGLQRFGDELELAAALVDGDAAADEDGEAVGGAEAEELRLAAEEDDGELSFAVLESEVDVAGGSGAAVGDLAFDPEVGVGGLDLLADAGDEGANAVDAALGGCEATA